LGRTTSTLLPGHDSQKVVTNNLTLGPNLMLLSTGFG
jgi:hypothetical protein